jgi:hypothetical protein
MYRNPYNCPRKPNMNYGLTPWKQLAEAVSRKRTTYPAPTLSVLVSIAQLG